MVTIQKYSLSRSHFPGAESWDQRLFCSWVIKKLTRDLLQSKAYLLSICVTQDQKDVITLVTSVVIHTGALILVH